MSLPIPNLDDKNFNDLVDEARKLIPLYAPRWTDHNLHDPGIMLVELFAWLSEMQLFHLNTITPRHLLKYLALLGIKPRPPAPARVEVQLEIRMPLYTIYPGKVAAGTPIKTSSPISPLTFEIQEDFEVLAVQIGQVKSYFNYQFTDVTKFNEHPQSFYHAFGKHPEEGDALYLGLSSGKSKADLEGKKVRLAIFPLEEDISPHGSDEGGGRSIKVYPSAEVAWEYQIDENKWESLLITGTTEAVLTLSARGFLSFDFPEHIKRNEKDGLFWIRCIITRAGYEIPPRLDRILTNVVYAVEGSGNKEELVSSGLPYQVFRTQKFPVVPGSLTLKVTQASQWQVQPEWQEWQAVDDFDASGPADRHYVLKPGSGEIYFGDGIKGSVPPANARIKLDYRCGSGTKGNVKAGTLTVLDLPDVRGSNPYPAYGGREEETVSEAFTRFRKDQKIPYTAVTGADYEYLVKTTPGLRAARAKAVITPGNEAEVTVVVVPESSAEKPLASSGFKRTIREYLYLHRPITTCVKVKDPEYVKVSVFCEIKIREGYGSEAVRGRVLEALNLFLAPLSKGGEGGWPFGRSVYLSEVNEILEGQEGVECVLSLTLRGADGKFAIREGNIEIHELGLVYPGSHEITIFEPQSKYRQEGIIDEQA